MALKGKECNDIYAYGNVITKIEIPKIINIVTYNQDKRLWM